MSVPRVYTAISAIIGELAQDGIAKRHTNPREQYQYRSIDDIYERLSPLLAQHRLCILPRIQKRRMTERPGETGEALVSVALKAAFDFVCAEDGSCHTIMSYGEALDAGDKATAKAMTGAYKSAVLQAFCIPVAAGDDADAQTYRLRSEGVVEPVQGWSRWSQDIIEIVGSCQTGEAIDRCQQTYRTLLRALALYDAQLYAGVGEAIRVRRQELARTAASAESPSKKRKPTQRQPRVRAETEAAHA